MENHLVREIIRRLERLPLSKRAASVREFIAKSSVNAKLVKRASPKLYREATSYSEDFSVRESSESSRPYELCAKPR